MRAGLATFACRLLCALQTLPSGAMPSEPFLLAPAVEALLARMAALPPPDRAHAQQCFGRLLRREVSTRLAEMEALLQARACFLLTCSPTSLLAGGAASSNVPTPLIAASDLIHAVLQDVHLTMHSLPADVDSSQDSDPMCMLDLRASLIACADLLATPPGARGLAVPAAAARPFQPSDLIAGSGADNDPISDTDLTSDNGTTSDASAPDGHPPRA